MSSLKYTEEKIRSAVALSSSLSEALRLLGANPTGNTRTHIKNRIALFNISTNHFTYSSTGTPKRDPDYSRFLVKTAPYVRTEGRNLRKAMLQQAVPYRCSGENCENREPFWGGKPLPLDVDHIDGDYTNSILNNLRFLCPNCHRQTETFGYKGNQTPKNICLDCPSEISNRAKRCVICSNRNKEIKRSPEKKVYPTTDILLRGVETYGMVGYSKQLDISDNGLRKLLKRRGVTTIPKKISQK